MNDGAAPRPNPTGSVGIGTRINPSPGQVAAVGGLGGYAAPPALPAGSAPMQPAAPAASSNPYNSDPAYRAAVDRQTTGVGAINTGLNNQILQRLVQFGDPSLAGQYGLDPALVQQATNSGFSMKARLNQAHQQNLHTIVNRLASHGLLFSGQTGFETGQEDQSYGNSLFDALQSVLGDVGGYQSSALQQKQGLSQDVVNALEQAYQNSLAHPEAYGYGQGGSPGGAPNVGTSQQVAAALARLSHTPDARNGF